MRAKLQVILAAPELIRLRSHEIDLVFSSICFISVVLFFEFDEEWKFQQIESRLGNLICIIDESIEYFT